MLNVGLMWMSTCLSGPVPEFTKPCASPAWATTMSPARASSVSPSTVNVASPSSVMKISGYG